MRKLSKKPIKRAYERKDANTQKWLNEEYPKIKREAKKEDAVIWWADETACVSLPSNLKGYAKKGSKIKPILTHPAQKFKINMISAGHYFTETFGPKLLSEKLNRDKNIETIFIDVPTGL